MKGGGGAGVGEGVWGLVVLMTVVDLVVGVGGDDNDGDVEKMRKT
jgi:hypothetical protein